MSRYADIDVLLEHLSASDEGNLRTIITQWLEMHQVEDVEPVVHAHWKEFEDYSGAVYPECSRCGLVWWLDEGTAEDNEMYYCPKCGAKMDEEVE